MKRERKAEEYMALTYQTEVVPDMTTEGTACYLASHPELPGCMSHGRTPEEALRNLDDARELYLRALLEKGRDIPIPAVTGTAALPFSRVIWRVEEVLSEATGAAGPPLVVGHPTSIS